MFTHLHSWKYVTCDEIWWISTCIQNHDFDHNNHHHNYSHHKNYHKIKTFQWRTVSKALIWKTCIQFILIYVMIWTKITCVAISKITFACLVHLSLTIMPLWSFSGKLLHCLSIVCSFLYNFAKPQYDIYKKVTYFHI